MSYLDYRNLRSLNGFNRDLNYTGIIADNWSDPLNVIPIILAVLCLVTGGLPLGHGFQAWWVLSNTVIFHPMDL